MSNQWPIPPSSTPASIAVLAYAESWRGRDMPAGVRAALERIGDWRLVGVETGVPTLEQVHRTRCAIEDVRLLSARAAWAALLSAC